MAKKLDDEELASFFADFDAAEGRGRDPLRALHWAVQFREYIELQLRDVVDEARASGATWVQIGEGARSEPSGGDEEVRATSVRAVVEALAGQ